MELYYLKIEGGHTVVTVLEQQEEEPHLYFFKIFIYSGEVHCDPPVISSPL